MIIGFVGFGKVAENLVRLIKSDDITFLTSTENRSSNTMSNIKRANVEVLPTFREVANSSDILISATSPKEALGVGERYGRYVKGIYLDLNNVSPDTTIKISEHVNDLVDGAIIGKIDSSNPRLYISGEKSEELLFLNDYIETKIISDRIGDASRLKLLRSTYTKTLSALLIESAQIAKNNNLEEEFFDILALTEGDDFKDKSKSRINNTLTSSKRKSEELEEIVDYFNGEDLTMVKAALKKLSQ